NLGLHLLIVGLVWGVASSLGLRWPWFAAGLMALHPLSSQAVSYISGRADLVSTAGIALAVWAMLARWPAALRVVVGLLGAWVAVAGKESGVVVLPLLVLAGLVRGYRLPASRWVAVGVVVALLTGSAVVGPKVAALNHRLATVGTGASDLVPAQTWAEKQAQATWIHVGHVVWPRALTVDHDVDASPFPALALLLWLWVPVAAWLCWLVSPVVGFGVAWVWVCVALRLVVQTPMSYLAEHQFYGALIGVSLLASALVGGRRRGEV
ncbi:MAG TPA: hypothetical protein VLH81_07630, partial [Desulfobacterales bacterium]|nr:hypothetical protein [Desulfobacterales bacterium]